MSVLLPTFRRVRLTQQCVIHPQDKGGNYLPCASEDWVLFVSLAADGEKIILRTEHRCLPIKPGGALLLPPNVCHELPFVQAPCLMLEFSAADDGQAMFEFPQLQGTPAWTLLQLLYSEQTTAAARTPLLDALLMQMAPMAHGFELCAPDAAFSLATEVLQHLNLCFADELSLTELTNRFHVSTSHMIHMFKAQFGLPPLSLPDERGLADAGQLDDLRIRMVFEEFHRVVKLLGVEFGRPSLAEIGVGRAGNRLALLRALHDHVALELRERQQHVAQQRVDRVVGQDAEVQYVDGDALVDHVGDHAGRLRHRPRQPVEPCHDQHIAAPQLRPQPVKLRALDLRAGEGVRINFFRARRRQRRLLRVQTVAVARLCFGRYSRVAEYHANPSVFTVLTPRVLNICFDTHIIAYATGFCNR